MATRSTINVQTEKGIKSIYCHWDGYPEHHLPILNSYYNSQEKAEALVELGNLSSLNESIEYPKGHSFNTPVEGYCIAYGRDRGEKDQEFKLYKSINEIEREEHDYYWNGKEWEEI